MLVVEEAGGEAGSLPSGAEFYEAFDIAPEVRHTRVRVCACLTRMCGCVRHKVCSRRVAALLGCAPARHRPCNCAPRRAPPTHAVQAPVACTRARLHNRGLYRI